MGRMIPLKKSLCLLLAGVTLLSCISGCGKSQPTQETSAAEQTLSQGYTAPDGDPNDVTCKGSYDGEADSELIVAQCGSEALTQGMLQAYYSLEVLNYLHSGAGPLPNTTLPFSQQPCEIGQSVNTWEQYFLKKALSTWHTAQALANAAEEKGLPAEEAYQPNLDNYAEYMTGMPATKYLYRYAHAYSPNSMHQAFLDDMESLLSQLAAESGFSSLDALSQGLQVSTEDLLEAAKLYNFGYMYLTTMEDELLPSDEEMDAYYRQNQGSFPVSGRYASIRQVLLEPEAPADEAQWDQCEASAKKMLADWAGKYRSGEGSFAKMAYESSADLGSNLQGGLYWHIAEGNLISPLNEWVFDSQRQSGNTTVLRSPLGIHILYYIEGNTQSYASAKDALVREKLEGFIAECTQSYPMTVQYSDIVLSGEPEGHASLSYGDILYPDIAHERFPEVPLYLQQDYGNTRYGNFPLRTYGCGITSLAMLSSYMTDTELTPPIMCERYGSYCSSWGTDYMIFQNEPQNMGYFLKKQVFDPDLAYEALKDGYVVISCQQKGYWTKTAHYLVLEKVDEKGVQVRDSNIYNYKRVPAHAEDRHDWSSITSSSVSFWIFEKKPVRAKLCARCGEPENFSQGILTADYQCKRCADALLRRNCYLGIQ